MDGKGKRKKVKGKRPEISKEGEARWRGGVGVSPDYNGRGERNFSK
jgi:hypothetical protein